MSCLVNGNKNYNKREMEARDQNPGKSGIWFPMEGTPILYSHSRKQLNIIMSQKELISYSHSLFQDVNRVYV